MSIGAYGSVGKVSYMRSSRIGVFIICLFCVFLGACTATIRSDDSSHSVTLSGKMGSDSRAVRGVRAVTFDMVGTLTIRQGTQEGLTVNADENLLPIIKSTVNDGTLTLTMNSSFRIGSIKGVTMDLNLQVKQLDALTLKGAGSINVLDLDGPKLTVDMSGAGSVTVAGKTTEQDIRLTGVGGYDSANTESQKVTVIVAGVGSAKVRVRSVLDATIRGVGSIEYIGNPTTLNKQVSGLGQMKQVSR